MKNVYPDDFSILKWGDLLIVDYSIIYILFILTLYYVCGFQMFYPIH